MGWDKDSESVEALEGPTLSLGREGLLWSPGGWEWSAGLPAGQRLAEPWYPREGGPRAVPSRGGDRNLDLGPGGLSHQGHITKLIDQGATAESHPRQGDDSKP